MGAHSYLGPTDPQVLLATEHGDRFASAQEILDQFEKARSECGDPGSLRVWLPMLTRYGPDLLMNCQNVLVLAEDLIREWLQVYMFSGQRDAEARAESAASWLSGHENFKSHGRHLSREDLLRHGMVVDAMEDDDVFQDLSLSVFHATTHTFSGTSCVKIVENHLGRAFVKQWQQIEQMVQVVPPQPQQVPN